MCSFGCAHRQRSPRLKLVGGCCFSCLCSLFSDCCLFQLSAGTDYLRLSITRSATELQQQRLISSSSSLSQRLYFWPLGPAAQAALQHKWACATATSAAWSTPGSSLASSSLASTVAGTSPWQPAALLPVLCCLCASWLYLMRLVVQLGRLMTTEGGGSGMAHAVPVRCGSAISVLLLTDEVGLLLKCGAGLTESHIHAAVACCGRCPSHVHEQT